MKDCVKIRQDIVDLIYSLESFTAQELYLKTTNIKGDEAVKTEIIEDILCHYSYFDLIMDEGRFYTPSAKRKSSGVEV